MNADKYESSFSYAHGRIKITARHDADDETACYNDFILSEAARIAGITAIMAERNGNDNNAAEIKKTSSRLLSLISLYR